LSGQATHLLDTLGPARRMDVAVLGHVGGPLGEGELGAARERGHGGVVEKRPAPGDGQLLTQYGPVHRWVLGRTPDQQHTRQDGRVTKKDEPRAPIGRQRRPAAAKWHCPGAWALPKSLEWNRGRFWISWSAGGAGFSGETNPRVF